MEESIHLGILPKLLYEFDINPNTLEMKDTNFLILWQGITLSKCGKWEQELIYSQDGVDSQTQKSTVSVIPIST